MAHQVQTLWLAEAAALAILSSPYSSRVLGGHQSRLLVKQPCAARPSLVVRRVSARASRFGPSAWSGVNLSICSSLCTQSTDQPQ